MTSQTSTSSLSLTIPVALGLITLLGPASIDMYLPSIPTMAAEMGAQYATMQLTLTVFLLAMGAGQLVFGPLVDALGRRRPLLVAISVFILAALWAAASQSVESLILARFVQGLAASLALVTAMSSVRDVAEGVVAAKLFALLMTIQGIGPVLAPALGGTIGAQAGWRAVFLSLAGLGIVVLVNTAFNLRETLPQHMRASPGLAGIVRTYADIVSDRKFLLPGLSLASAFFFLFAYIGGASYAYQTGYGLSSSSFGFVFGATGIAVLAGAMGSARLVAHFRIEKLALGAAFAMFAGAVVSLVSALAGAGLPGIVAGMFLSLGGLGMAEATLMSIALATRRVALGASAAVLGAFPLLLGSAATPLAAVVAGAGAVQWLGFLTIAGMVTALLTLATARAVAGSGIRVELQH